MKKIIKLKESELINLIKTVIKEEKIKLNELDVNKAIEFISQFAKKPKSTSLTKTKDKDKDDDVDFNLGNESAKEFILPIKDRQIPKGNYGINRKGLDKPGKTHPGVDVSASSGTELRSIGNGVVIDAEIRNDACGGTLYIDHKNGYKSRFCHLKQINVKKGDKVKKGEVVALTGGGAGEIGHGFSTGPHLHFELYRDNKLIDPSSVFP